tara:strand:+ start:8476 stop:8859 length:384 start_codon:yes stop_codon:yes gene_type:complete
MEEARHKKYDWLFVCALALFIPGSGHMWLGRRNPGLIFFGALSLMFFVGLWLQGTLFPFDFGQPLVVLAAFAELGMGGMYAFAVFMGIGDGSVVNPTHEHGNTFLIVSGLLNALVVLDVYDIVHGRK